MFVRPIELFDTQLEKKKTEGVISAFRKRVNDHREAGTLWVPTNAVDQQHVNLISELSELKGMSKVSDRIRRPASISTLAAVNVDAPAVGEEIQLPSSPSEIVIEQITEDQPAEVATPPSNTETVELDT